MTDPSPTSPPASGPTAPWAVPAAGVAPAIWLAAMLLLGSMAVVLAVVGLVLRPDTGGICATGQSDVSVGECLLASHADRVYDRQLEAGVATLAGGAVVALAGTLLTTRRPR